MSKIGDQGSGIGDRDRFDTAVDRAVREMLDVEPPAGLRGRVLVELSSNSVASAFRRKIFWIAAPTFAAAAIILAVVAPWRPAAPPVVTSVPRTIARVEPAPVVAPRPAPENAEPSHRTMTRTIPQPAGRQPEAASRGGDEGLVAAAVAPDEDAGTVINPLAPIAPIVAAGTHPPDIAPKEIAISPMAPIAQLQIAPLSPSERRN